MAKSKTRLISGLGSAEQKTFSSGVTVTMLPFPVGLYQDIQEKALAEFPEPVPPKKTIKVVDGTEIIDDLDNPDYKAKVKQLEQNRTAYSASLIGEAVIDLCIQVDLSPWENQIKRLEKFTTPFSADPDERRIEFMTRFGLRGKADYETAITTSIALMVVGDPEVADKLNSFQDNLERSIALNA